jgi:LytS/YehU family sensor histidine kinase
MAPVSVHFVNNVLAVAASYIEEDAERARDVLAELGAFLTHRLRGPRAVSLPEELEHVRIYLSLESARFVDRIVVELPDAVELPDVYVGPGDVQGPVADALGRWLIQHHGRVRVALRPRGEALDLQLDRPDDPAQPGERVRIPLGLATAGSAA